MKNNIAIIPARGSSKRLPGKNIKLFNNKPLLAYSIAYALQNKSLIKDVLVTTDDDEIAKIAIAFGAKVIKRPPELAGDLEPTVSAIKHALETYQQKVDYVFILQPTNPLRPDNLMQESYKKLIDTPDSNSCFTVSKSTHKLGKIRANKYSPFNYEYGQRSQDIEPLFYENGMLYISHVNAIMNNEIISTNHICIEVNHPYAKIDIDTETDFLIAEAIYKALNKNE